MEVDTVFRGMFGIKKDQVIVELIEAAVSVANSVVPDKLKKHRSRIVKLLFDEDPANSNDLFSDDELGFDSDDDTDKVTVSSLPKKEKLMRKSVELSGKVDATLPTLRSMSEKMVEHHDKSVEATKKMVGLKNHEDAEKKAKRKIDCMDFPEPKKLCGEIDRGKMKPPSGNVRQRLRSSMKKMKAKYVNQSRNWIQD